MVCRARIGKRYRCAEEVLEDSEKKRKQSNRIVLLGAATCVAAALGPKQYSPNPIKDKIARTVVSVSITALSMCLSIRRRDEADTLHSFYRYIRKDQMRKEEALAEAERHYQYN